MNKKVTSQQVTHAAVIIIMTTSLLTKQLYIYTQNDAWVTVIASYCVCLLIYLIYAALVKNFPGYSLIQINETIFGRVLGKLISALYVYFFFLIAALNVNVMGNFTKAFVLPNTPIMFTLVVFVAVCVWAVSKGLQNLMRYSVLFSVGTIVIILINALFLVKDYDAKNFLPFLSLPPSNYFVGIHSLSMIPLSDPIVLLMFIPDMQKPNEFGRALFKGLTIGAIILLIIVLRDIAVLGQSSEVYSFPSFLTIRTIDIGDVITRMEIIYVSVLLTLMFYKVSVLFYATLSGIQHICHFDSYKFLIYCFGTLLIIFSLTVFPSSGEHSAWLMNGAAAVDHTLYVVVLPLLTLVIAVIRGLFKPKDTANIKKQ